MAGGMNYVLTKDNPVKLVRNQSGYWEVASAPKAYTHHIKRKEFKQAKEKYAEIRDYVIGIAKLRENGEVAHDEHREVFGEVEYKYEEGGTTYKRPDLPRVSATSPECINLIVKWFDEGKQYKAFMFTHYLSGTWRIRSKKVANIFDMFILAKHRDEVLKKVELPEGVSRKSKYHWFFD
jgi:hypothetical protein